MYSFQTIVTTTKILAKAAPWKPVGMSAALAITLATGIFAVAPAHARPEMAAGQQESSAARFQAMDTNKDGKVTREEFFAAQPQMKEAAFLAIDSNKDDVITLEEWESFSMGHAKGEARPGEMGGMGGMPPKSNATAPAEKTEATPGKGKTPDLIMPSSSSTR